ncbi:carboxymuconolactone decarboxylase family protein [Sporomusa termitida]|nr:carboxymuconolactone decarboxylase family protein [Sporomusa termitida]
MWDENMVEIESRYQRGLQKMREMTGETGEEAILPLDDLGKYIIEFAFGDILSRSGLTLRDREIVIITALTVLGREAQLKVHFPAAMKVGLSVAELEEIIIQTSPYAGFPTAINALQVLRNKSLIVSTED